MSSNILSSASACGESRLAGNSAATKRQVIDYYNHTLNEYRLVLGLDSHRGIHYGYYDDQHRTYAAASQNMNRLLADKAGVTASHHVLDAGCGIGGSSIWLAENRAARVTGITITPAQRDHAQRLAAAHGVADRTQFLLRDYCRTDFADESFDLVWGLESICYADDKRSFVREAWRVLRPGGRLVVADGFRTRRGNKASDEWLLRRWLDGWAVRDLDTLDEFAASLREANYHNISVDDITPQVMPFAETLRRRVTPLMPIALIMLWLGLWSSIKVNNGRSALYQYPALRRGLWRYAVFVADKPA